MKEVEDIGCSQLKKGFMKSIKMGLNKLKWENGSNKRNKPTQMW